MINQNQASEQSNQVIRGVRQGGEPVNGWTMYRQCLRYQVAAIIGQEESVCDSDRDRAVKEADHWGMAAYNIRKAMTLD